MTTQVEVNLGSGNGFLSDDAETLPELVLTYHQWGPVTIIWGNYKTKTKNSYQLLKLAWNLFTKIFIHISQGPVS